MVVVGVWCRPDRHACRWGQSQHTASTHSTHAFKCTPTCIVCEGVQHVSKCLTSLTHVHVGAAQRNTKTHVTLYPHPISCCPTHSPLLFIGISCLLLLFSGSISTSCIDEAPPEKTAKFVTLPDLLGPRGSGEPGGYGVVVIEERERMRGVGRRGVFEEGERRGVAGVKSWVGQTAKGGGR